MQIKLFTIPIGDNGAAVLPVTAKFIWRRENNVVSQPAK